MFKNAFSALQLLWLILKRLPSALCSTVCQYVSSSSFMTKSPKVKCFSFFSLDFESFLLLSHSFVSHQEENNLRIVKSHKFVRIPSTSSRGPQDYTSPSKIPAASGRIIKPTILWSFHSQMKSLFSIGSPIFLINFTNTQEKMTDKCVYLRIFFLNVRNLS